ncbi:FKBP-type peptidyl-prolyl cis-trans isomerase [Neptuniibacter pectenicola]|jgi:FKBP-type peptidyl-prolyl cis-trans isomerase FklB|uniref:Peptidyl-prolyl cis-trans isomerase n=1 Tax=Neptuniibacter pectenicola TaxID=1806669 RepID=A0ABU9TMC5_9GAMM|nr:FKBP-type peptidyl-prolyl cis-trans isomerase [Neptuniibacter pectenicola]KXJ56788.1 MAG: peptidylprolyl isomerase [Neptuniibacter sp. Phe_28]|tara:strand:+ start:726 stop:1352 length:627 start_codon:yes stop_codon:yes gene_type:complete|eukprot:gnl/Carplike_NY0171/1221_a1645_495.p2 GENE.gnl/Carplike_NY0171/1221_a1645_495~~gnl/Carplike_NY0171/1221_a1645_495.p2  ORF type:complete len:209 (-),score=40.91 gnl/Carplike_NY0171/1221_a1645_495:49-675(-)
MSDVQLETLEQKASYGIGRQMGDQLAQQPFEGMDIKAISAGIADAVNGDGMQVEVSEIQEAFNVLNERMRAQQEEEAKKASAVGEAFLTDNAKRDGVVVLESGLQYEILEAGEEGSEKPTRESKVRTHYHGTFIDGKVFDSSYDRGQPAEFPVGGVIAGWTEALQLMNKGAKWKLYIPYNLAYGEQGSPGGIPPYSALVFDVELLEIL